MLKSVWMRSHQLEITSVIVSIMKMHFDGDFACWYDFLIPVLENSQVKSDAILLAYFTSPLVSY